MNNWTAFFESADGIKGSEPTHVRDDHGSPPFQQIRVAARPLRVWLDHADSEETITNSRLVHRRYEVDKIDHGHRIVWYKERLT